ncbi:MAG: hypothetical protein CMJ85_09620 [Planctomycetes bacterium]|nr:hypothetical protein [Planctomycetota bacterium]MDP6425006.1 GNAT family N-acetyltransferase [Planctomycetota bacterium]
MSELQDRPLDPYADAEELIELFDQVFGFTITPAMWAWKYVPPWTTRFYCWVGIADGKIIGYCGAVPLRGWMDGKDAMFFQLADFMVHPDWRRKHDFFGRAVQQFEKDTVGDRKLVYGFSDHRAFLLLRRQGYCDLVEKATARFVHPNGRIPRYEFREWKFTEPTIDALWLAQRDQIGTALVRDTRYLAWRYGSHPANRYRVFGVFDGATAIGWTLIGADPPGERDRIPEVPVVDMLLPEAAMKDTLESLAKHLDHSLAAWFPQRLASGLEDTRETSTNVYHFVKGSTVDTVLLRDSLYYTMGDVDWW